MYKPTRKGIRIPETPRRSPIQLSDLGNQEKRVEKIISDLQEIREIFNKKLSEFDSAAYGTLSEASTRFVKELEFFNEKKGSLETLVQIVSKRIQEAEELSRQIRVTQKGDKGEPGKDAVPPTVEEISAHILPILKLPEPKQPEKIDYQKIIRSVLNMVPPPEKGEPGKSVTLEEVLVSVLDAIKSGKLKISSEDVLGLEEKLAQVRRQAVSLHGSGDSVVAGTNVTITTNSNGQKVINAIVSSGSNISTEEVIAVTSGSNVTIDLTQLAHTPTTVLFVSRGGIIQMPNGNASIPGSSWSQTGMTVTVYNADRDDGYLVQYAYA